MPQSPIAVNPKPYPPAISRLNITAATVVKATPGTLVSVNVVTAGSAPGTASDVATNAPAAGNLFFDIPNAVGVYTLNWPFANGLLIVPGNGQVVAVAYR